MQVTEGQLVALQDARFALVAARFNDLIVDRLIDGAADTLRRHGVPEEHLELIRVPGSFELPLAVQRVADAGRADAVIALGAVIRGGTDHHQYVAAECTKGVAQAMMGSGVPVSYGVLTVETVEQAIERAGTKAGNKGAEAALSALEMVDLMRQLEA
ncbi:MULTISPECIES: 6,7-dimethyl-8-ribityllumazine synthase [Halorhodospira]|uniref:6,7-dimethyl-8-ribityllumazine synthase n=1 Tax=Halorhodospira halophila (strain DSM 244 / SL1) TaxID=349124 RepID=RISB_HALHL|nr:MULTISPECIES: 6,7-dimethyl-8-ribityllumazine synthase [Halorhodospira]A1WVG1.1 RecName: Full=6,7-dimethyl-8-ribityllumazine synthase; Short=DMRL synthase; Short=LS; Short=Lumazine synthase [Halorhodospira halophila SL1]ABM61673.1 6,7-dimethyl-8-ribityllumazine synthase [Halorhodospira halophila SL1]MBK1728994.1 6,7-dimethyl-8-ribityllumazine synthase [Halorhodospira halophila]MBK5935406.1 6,7-dimethyl-8-ribityllumazine synthase [Halorhodospira halophila]MBK5943220.1 6,7-dimethyl-8-ribityllu